ncbi:MAG: Holliday junction resolvase RuvX [Rubrobacteraceae bacterium]
MQASECAPRRVAALDLGEVRTGVAVSDTGGSVARPLAILSPEDLSGCLRSLVEEENVKEVVVGVPKTLGGEIGFQAKRVLQKLESLRDEFPGVRFVEWDERFTTRLVTGTGTGSRGRGKKARKPVDDLAAARMLQEYLYTRGGN